MHSSLHFLIDITFNLALVDDSACGSWKNNILQLILSACLWSPSEMFSRLLIQPFSPSQAVETMASLPALPSPKRTSNIVRGRDLPFPTLPTQRNRTSQAPPPNPRTSVLFQQRYSTVLLPTVTVTAANPDDSNHNDTFTRGRTLQQRLQPMPRPALSRSDSRMLSPETVERTDPGVRRMSKNSTLLRVPPFPLPHRALQRPTSESPRRAVEQKGPRPVSKRVSFKIPPPLVLESIAQLLEEEGDDSPVLGWEETSRLMQRRPVPRPAIKHDGRCHLAACNPGVQSEARRRRFSVSRASHNM